MYVKFLPLQEEDKLVLGYIFVQLLGQVSELSLVVFDDECDAGSVPVVCVVWMDYRYGVDGRGDLQPWAWGVYRWSL